MLKYVYKNALASGRTEFEMEKKNIFTKALDFLKEKTKNVNWKIVWDKITTGFLIILLASPILILAYIFLWFVFK